MNNNHNTHFYSLEETKRILETTKEFEDGEQIYYFIGALRYLYDEYNKQKEVLDKIRKNNERIIDYGFDYDGFNNVEDLKKLIDMLVDYARKNNELLEEIE